MQELRGEARFIKFARQRWRAWIETVQRVCVPVGLYVRPSAMAGVD